MRVDPAWLMGYDVPMKPQKQAAPQPTPIPPGFQPMPEMATVPIVGRIACGTPILAEQNIEGSACVPARWRATFSLVCKGDSMEPKIHDGDPVAIRKQPEVEAETCKFALNFKPINLLATCSFNEYYRCIAVLRK